MIRVKFYIFDFAWCSSLNSYNAIRMNVSSDSEYLAGGLDLSTSGGEDESDTQPLNSTQAGTMEDRYVGVHFINCPSYPHILYLLFLIDRKLIIFCATCLK